MKKKTPMNSSESPLINASPSSSFSNAAPLSTTTTHNYSPILSNGIVHSVTAEVNSPPSIAEYSTSRKRAFETITSSSPEPSSSIRGTTAAASLRWSSSSQQAPQQQVAQRELVHMLAFSESDDEGEQELMLLQQQHEIALKQHQSRHQTNTNLSNYYIQPRSSQPVSLNSMPALGYRSYQPDVVRSIFR